MNDTDERKVPAPDKYLGSLSRLYSVLEIGKSPGSDMTLFLKTGISESFVEVIRGAILVTGLDARQLRADTEEVIRLLEDNSKRTIEFLHDLELNIDVKANWSVIKDHRLNSQLLLQAIIHPAWFVCRFAAMLLLEYADEPEIKSGIVAILKEASGYTLHIIAQIAQKLWGDDAGLIILKRLETNCTDDCGPIIKALGEIVKPPIVKRVVIVLRNNLESKAVEILEATVDAINKLNLFDVFQSEIKSKYEWWIKEGPQDPKESGVVPENAAKCLFEILCSHQKIGLAELKDAINANRSDVRKVAIEAICRLCIKDNDSFLTTIFDIENLDLPVSVINEFAKSYLSFCALHINDFLPLLESQNINVKLAAINLFSNKELKTDSVEKKLRLLLESTQIEVRNNALLSLRKLVEQ